MCKEEEKKGESKDKINIKSEQPDRKKPPAFSTNIEKILLKAVEDENFRNALFKDRKSALANPELSLSPQDRIILESIPAPALTANLTNLMKSKLTSRRTFLQASAASFGFLVGSLFGGYYGVPTIGCKKQFKCDENMRKIREALRVYSHYNSGVADTIMSRGKYGVYPFSLEQLTQKTSKHKPYLEKIPTCPISSTPYIYEVYKYRGVNCNFIEGYLNRFHYKKEKMIYSTFLGQLFYMEEKKTCIIRFLLIIEQIFGIKFSIFWECNAQQIDYQLRCENQRLHMNISEWEASLFPLFYQPYPLTAGIR